MKGAWQLVRGGEDGEPVSEYVVKNLEFETKAGSNRVLLVYCPRIAFACLTSLMNSAR